MLAIGSLFSGIGGLELGMERAGVGRTVWQVESDPYCRAVLARHWPNAVRYNDVRTARDLPPVDVVCGGFPCQDVSGAGKRIGLEGARSGLWYEFARIVAESNPRFVVVENVASGKGRWLSAVRSQLCQLGYRTRAIALSAADVGAPHLRRRVFVLADRDGEPIRLERRRAEPGAAASIAGHARGAMGEPIGNGLEDDEQAGAATGAASGPTLAHGHGIGCLGLSAPWLHDHGRERDDASRCHRFPPRRGDEEGWREYIACSGPEPGLRRGANGVSTRLDGRARRRRLKALGNAVVPQCAEVVGRMLVESMAHAIDCDMDDDCRCRT